MARLMIGFSAGWMTSTYLFGAKQTVIPAETLAILEDETSLKYAQYVKQQEREKKGQ